MPLKNTADRYGAVAKTFHWVVALLIIGMLCAGLYMTRVEMSMTDKMQVFGLHKSVGILVLMLASLRLLWKLINTYPIPLPSHRQWEKSLAALVHSLLYVMMFLMPLTGWLGSSAKGFSVSVFHLFTLPDLVARDKGLADLLWTVHEYAAYSLIVLIGLHFAGAMKHVVIDRDGTLRRMLPFTRP
ncbi:MAG: cytochrome b561 family protein [Micavibrio sp.]|nr:cytochrome b561 family protein [Micavibrio sp.]